MWCQSEGLDHDATDSRPWEGAGFISLGPGMHFAISSSPLTVRNINVAFSRLIFKPIKNDGNTKLSIQFSVWLGILFFSSKKKKKRLLGGHSKPSNHHDGHREKIGEQNPKALEGALYSL